MLTSLRMTASPTLAAMLISRPDKIFTKRVLTIAGIRCTVERKNIKRLNLYVKPPDGEVLVTAPFLYTERQIISFITAKADWIRKHQERIRSKAPQSRRALEYVTGETLFFWGKPYRLTVIEDPSVKRGKILLEPEPVFEISGSGSKEAPSEKSGKVLMGPEPKFRSGMSGHDEEFWDKAGEKSDPARAVLMVPEGSTHEQREQIVRKKYKQLLEQEAPRILDLWSERTGLEYSSWHSRYMVSRWGSLIVKDRRVCLNTRLAEKPEICLIYVALHEIAHVKEANHGPKFKEILNKYMPDWKLAEKILKQ